MNRRDALKSIGMASLFPPTGVASEVAGRQVAIQVSAASANTVRFSVQGLDESPGASDGSLVRESWGAPVRIEQSQTIKLGNLRVTVSIDPLAMKVETGAGIVQHIKID